MATRCTLGWRVPPPPRRATRSAAVPTPPRASDEAVAFSYAVKRAAECIHDAPRGQLLGRGGERCTLEDGERHARRAATLRPHAAEAAELVVEALAKQRGREQDAIGVAVDALTHCDGLRQGDGAARAAARVAAAALHAVKRRGGDLSAAAASLTAAASEGVRQEVEAVAREV